MRTAALLPLLLFAAVPASGDPAPDTGVIALAGDSEARWIPFELTAGNQIRFTANIDGRAASAILDTGASHSVLSTAFARRAGLSVSARGRIVAVGGSVALGWVPVTAITFGGLARAGGGLSVVDLPTRATGAGAGVDMLAGRDLTQGFALDIDYAARRFRLLPSGRLPFVGAQLPLRIGRAPLAYVTRVTIAGHRLEPIIVDTGDGASLALSRAAWRTLPLAPAPMVTTALAYGVGGPIEFELATLPRILFGGVGVNDVDVAIEQTGGFSDNARSAGRIGMGFLQRFRVLLDPGAGRMVLAPQPGSAPPPRSTSGLQLQLSRGRLTVLHVMRNSPADTAGWKTGDTICAVDGTAVKAGDTAATSWPYARPGRTLTLGMCDGAVRQLTLRRFY